MLKITRATERGQITLPKKWRDMFKTNDYQVEIKEDELVIKPFFAEAGMENELTQAWNDYKKGKAVSHEALMKKYGL